MNSPQELRFDDRWIDEREYCKIRGCKLQTARNQRFRGVGCSYYKIGSSVRYRLSEVIKYIEGFRVNLPKGGGSV